MKWEDVDWNILESLRSRFLSETPGGSGDYWIGERELEHYALAFAPRIGWKWDAVLREAQARGWAPPSTPLQLLDWGCGTGIATQRLLRVWSAAHFSQVQCWDRSARARAFAARKSGELGIRAVEAKRAAPPDEPFVLLISHVLNELDHSDELEACLQKAETIFWVEPGTPELSRRLIAFREQLRASFTIIGPCPHQGSCGLLKATHHWCHHFADPPTEVFQSADWERFGRKLGIDRRSLPVSFLILQRRGPTEAVGQEHARVLGRPRMYKGYAKVLACRESGIEELTVKKKDDTAAFKQLGKEEFTKNLCFNKQDELSS